MTTNKEIEITKKLDVQNGDAIWNKKGITILKLPDYLEGAILFRLPYGEINPGTIFTIVTRPSSTIYIARTKDSGWPDATFSNNRSYPGWKEEYGEVTTKRPNVTPKAAPKLKIWSKQTGTDNSTELSPTSTGIATVAIFVKEGKMHSLKYV